MNQIKEITCFDIRKGYYLADTDGNIYIKSTGRKKKVFLNSSGYRLVSLVREGNLGAKGYLVHRVILQTFNPIDNPDKFEVNHKCGKDKGDCVDNLEWTTNKLNKQHAYATGLAKAKKCEDSPVTDYTNDFVNTLCRVMETNYYFDEIIQGMFDHGYILVLFPNDKKKLKNLITSIRMNLSWKDISLKYNIIRRPKQQYGAFSNIENIHLVCQMIIEGYSNKEISIKIFNNGDAHHRNLIRSIRNNRTYRYISKDYW